MNQEEEPRRTTSKNTKKRLQDLEDQNVTLEAENIELRGSNLAFITSSEEYSDLYDFAPIGYFTLDNRFTILRVNATGAKLLNIDPKILIKTPFTLYVASKDRDRFRDHVKKTIETKTIQESEIELHPRQKPIISSHLQSIYIKSIGIFMTVSDVTLQKTLENELQATNKELETFSYSVSHDLRAPLRSITGFSQILTSESAHLTDQEKDYLHRISENAIKMNTTIDAILRLSRETRKELRYETVDLSNLAEQSLSQLRKEDPGRIIKTSIQPCQAYGDKDLLWTALNNLLRNAWKFTKNTTNPSIELGCQDKDDETVYFVRDNGAGFDMKYADRLFEPFQRLHAEKEFRGTGIGLSIVQRIIHKHKGRIWAEGKPGQGAIFYFTLPRQL